MSNIYQVRVELFFKKRKAPLIKVNKFKCADVTTIFFYKINYRNTVSFIKTVNSYLLPNMMILGHQNAPYRF